ncbi:hypothetical protein HDE_13177 [Halotydeus destructor]|nr:hypothetical protein HDE_13177 [Halotydeus destructor]
MSLNQFNLITALIVGSLTLTSGQNVDCQVAEVNGYGRIIKDISLDYCGNTYKMLYLRAAITAKTKVRGEHMLPVPGIVFQAANGPDYGQFTAITESGDTTWAFRNGQGIEETCSWSTSCSKMAVGTPSCTSVASLVFGPNETLEAAAILPNGTFIFAVELNNGTKYHSFKVSNKDGSLLYATPYVLGQSPTAMTVVPPMQSDQVKMAVVINDLVGIYDFKFSLPANQIALKSSINYQQTKSWAGCPADMCFDGSVDSASALDGAGDMALYKGTFLYKLAKIGGQLTQPTALPTDSTHTDAAFILDDGHVFIRGSSYVGNHIPAHLPTLDPSKQYDAAFVVKMHAAIGWREALVLIENRNLHAYDITNASLREVEAPDLEGVPFPVDGALALNGPSGADIVFLKDNFFMVIHLNTSGAISVKTDLTLMQGNLFQCPDDFYKWAKASKMLGLHSYDEFATYRMQFKPTGPDGMTTISGGPDAVTPTGGPDAVTSIDGSSMAPPVPGDTDPRVSPVPKWRLASTYSLVLYGIISSVVTALCLLAVYFQRTNETTPGPQRRNK